MNEALKAGIKGRKSKLTNEFNKKENILLARQVGITELEISSTKEEIYSKLYDSSDYLLDNECYLPRSITVSNEKVDLRLNENERQKLKNIIWYVSHSKLWSEL